MEPSRAHGRRHRLLQRSRARPTGRREGAGAVDEAQRLFDASHSQAAGENIMSKKRDLERAKLFVDRAERLGAEEQRRADDVARDGLRMQLATLENVAGTHQASAEIAAMVEAARPAFEALAQLDRDVLKRLRKALEAARAAEQIRAQLEGRPLDRARVEVAVQAIGALERMHASTLRRSCSAPACSTTSGG